MKPFREIRASDIRSSRLRDEIDSHGYLLVRGLLPTSVVRQILEEITEIMHAERWTAPGSLPSERIANAAATCSDPDPSYKRVKECVFGLESFHALAHHPA